MLTLSSDPLPDALHTYMHSTRVDALQLIDMSLLPLSTEAISQHDLGSYVFRALIELHAEGALLLHATLQHVPYCKVCHDISSMAEWDGADMPHGPKLHADAANQDLVTA